MRVFLIVDEAMWLAAKQSGVLRGAPMKASQNSLAWLRQQLQDRLKTWNGETPVIGWTSIARDEWDLHGRPGERKVYVEAEVSPDQVLSMHFLGWEMFVQANWYLATTPEEDKQMEESKPSQQQIEKSWERIFSPWMLYPFIPDRTIQLLINEVSMEDVVTETPFVVTENGVEDVYDETPDFGPSNDYALSLNDPRISNELRALLSETKAN